MIKRKRQIFRVLSAILFFTAFSLAIQAQTPTPTPTPVPFLCTGQAFTVRFSPALIYSIDQDVSPFTFTQIGGIATINIGGVPTQIELNNMGFRSTDGFLYAMALRLESLSPRGNYGIVKIDSNGNIFPVSIPAPPPIPGLGSSTYRFPAGDVSPDGNTMYINAQITSYATSANQTLYKVDLNTLTAATISKTLPGGFSSVNVADWAISPIDGDLYGSSYAGQIFRMNPTTGVITTVTGTGFLPSGSSSNSYDAYGGAWFNAAGRYFAYRNIGEIYEIDLSGPTIMSSQTGGPSSRFNDAAACAAQVVSIDVEKSISVDGGNNYEDADDPPGPSTYAGEDVYIKFVVTNTGTLTLSNIQLEDSIYDLSGCSIPPSLEPQDFFECLIGPLTAGLGLHTNTAITTGTWNSETATDSDDANYTGMEPPYPSIDIEKYVSVDGGTTYHDADYSSGPIAIPGADIYFKLVVTNTGDVPLDAPYMIDTDFDLSGCVIPDPLNPSDSFECIIGPFPTSIGQHKNTATAYGYYDDELYSDSDDAYYTVMYWAFTPGFWKNNIETKGKASHDAWKYTDYETGDLLGDVFDEDCLDDYLLNEMTFDEYTLHQALSFKGGGNTIGALQILLRSAVASLLNASFHENMGNPIGPDGVFPYTVAEVIEMVNEAICSGDRTTMLNLAEHLDWINNGLHYFDWHWPVP